MNAVDVWSGTDYAVRRAMDSVVHSRVDADVHRNVYRVLRQPVEFPLHTAVDDEVMV